MDDLAFRPGDGWLTRFAILQGLAVIVAVMGLSADSAAVVIGAMLLAPLMTPVLAMAASLAMALPRRAAKSGAVVLGASVLSIAAAYLLAKGLTDGPLPGEVLSRTRPDLRDLLVALAAGAAGAYATVRKDVSSALPGVAVAVALVPPLAVVGMTLEAGETGLARSAALLFAANLAAIALVSTLVFLATGFVPARRFRERRMRVLGSATLAAIATIAVAVPLAYASVGAARDGRQRDQVRQAAEDWLDGSGDTIEGTDIDGDDVTVEVSGPNPPPSLVELSRSMKEVLGPATVTEVQWTQTQAPLEEEEGDATAEATSERTAIRGLVDAWLEASGSNYALGQVEIDDSGIQVDLTSAEPPPPVDDLAKAVQEQLGVVAPITVNWTQRTELQSGANGPSNTINELTARLEREAADWASGNGDVIVSSVTYDGEVVTVDLLGSAPGDAVELQMRLLALAGVDKDVQIWFTERQQLAVPLGGG